MTGFANSDEEMKVIDKLPYRRSHHMNKDEASGNWKQFTGKIKEQWGKLTDDDLTVLPSGAR